MVFISDSPALSVLWDSSKNIGLSPTSVQVGSNKTIWWKCKEGHEWEAQPNSLKRSNACPFCSGKKILVGFNDFATTHPGLAGQWHPTKNSNLLPTQLSYGSKRKVWWLGECGHEWEATIGSRAVSGQGCAVCRGLQVQVGFNDFASTHPELAKQWHPMKNGVLLPTQITSGSGKKVWWLGECGHEWLMSVGNRSSGQGCAVCRGLQVQVGFNDFASTHPELVKQWHSKKNSNLLPTQITSGSNKKVWWKCSEGHEWEASPAVRLSNGCPVCVGQKLVTGVNDLASQYSELVVEFSNKNILLPSNVYKFSHQKVLWVCDKGHEWEAAVVSRTKSGSSCPYCGNKKLLIGFNDFAFTHPELAKQWHPTKNAEVLPSAYTYGYNAEKFWWLGSCGHEWEAPILSRTSGYGCPSCPSPVSSAELQIAEYLKILGFSFSLNDRSVLGRRELDIYLPEKNIAIEFNGLYWHSEIFKTKNYHYDKWKACKDKGVQLIQIWEDDWNFNSDLVKRMIAYKLGVSFGFKVYARNTVLREISSGDARKFLEINHLQGFRTAKYIGLFDVGSLVAVLGFSRKGDDGLEVIRFATSGQVVGGFSKLLSYVLGLSEYVYVKKVFSYSHNDHSDGGVYSKNGFELMHEGVPGYSYWSNGWKRRENRLKYSPSRIKSNPDLLYKEGLTERELAALNKLVRVWDSGSSLWVKEV